MRHQGLAIWLRNGQQAGCTQPLLCALRRLVLHVFSVLALVALPSQAPLWAEASRPEMPQPVGGQPLPFSSEADVLTGLGSDFKPIRELFLNIALAQLCGLKTKQVEAEYLARRAQLAQREDLDFDTLKALRYLSYVSLERTLRAVEPAQLRPWCDAQSATLNSYFQPQL